AERMPFASYSDLDYEMAREALAPLLRQFRVRVSRRLHLAKTGRLDFRRTIRAAIQRGGAVAELRMRARRPRHIDLVLLADVSGSVKYASALMLELTAGARFCFRRVRSFVFIDHLAEAGFEQGHVTMAPPLDLYARSDFGHVLGELWARRAELLGRATVMLIMGDGRNNRRPSRADLMRQITAGCRAVIWLNPEPTARWNTGDSVIAQYGRAVSTLVACENLAILERELSHLI
ncbi:MAG: VWA domain-containing protein, partial [Candidatus Binataceae bacterium]